MLNASEYVDKAKQIKEDDTAIGLCPTVESAAPTVPSDNPPTTTAVVAAAPTGATAAGGECRTICRKMASRWRLFCEGSSIRGVQKILKARSPFIKILWLSFVVVMTLVLIIVSGFLVKDFLNYDTAWHTSTAFDVKPEFPSFTLCAHSPFSYEAQSLWDTGAVMSPLRFQQMLKDVTRLALAKDLQLLNQMYAYDNIETYYQQLSYNETMIIGHSRGSLFFCVFVVGGHQYIADNCEMPDIYVSVRLFSYGEYFNCFTVDADNANYSREFEYIIVIMSLVPMEKLPQMSRSFLYDVLTRGEGVKVTIHEKNTIPDFAQSGFNVEPGRMSEISYGTTGWRKLATPKRACRDNQPPVRHLERDYTGNYHQCVNAKLQKRFIEQCGCQSTLWPVLKVPDVSAPYCTDVRGGGDGSAQLDYLQRANSRMHCAQLLLEVMESLKRNLSASCLPRCTYSTYETALSIAKWVPSASKLATLAEHYKAGNLYRSSLIDNAEFLEIVGRNISDNSSSEYSKHLSQQNAYTYIKIRRRNWDMTVKEEKLTLDVNILLSRIGGLCSLCIGLTAAFVVEILEFFYLSTRGDIGADEIAEADDCDGAEDNPSATAVVASGSATERANLLDPWEKDECMAFRPPISVLAAFADADATSDAGSPLSRLGGSNCKAVSRRQNNNHSGSVSAV